jgi:hypothetical protein
VEQKTVWIVAVWHGAQQPDEPWVRVRCSHYFVDVDTQMDTDAPFPTTATIAEQR